MRCAAANLTVHGREGDGTGDPETASAAAHLLQRLFEGSPELLMASLFEGRKISAEEFERLRRLVEEERP